MQCKISPFVLLLSKKKLRLFAFLSHNYAFISFQMQKVLESASKTNRLEIYCALETGLKYNTNMP